MVLQCKLVKPFAVTLVGVSLWAYFCCQRSLQMELCLSAFRAWVLPLCSAPSSMGTYLKGRCVLNHLFAHTVFHVQNLTVSIFSRTDTVSSIEPSASSLHLQNLPQRFGKSEGTRGPIAHGRCNVFYIGDRPVLIQCVSTRSCWIFAGFLQSSVKWKLRGLGNLYKQLFHGLGKGVMQAIQI